MALFGDELKSTTAPDPVIGERTATLEQVRLHPCSHYVTPRPALQHAALGIEPEPGARLAACRHPALGPAIDGALDDVALRKHERARKLSA